MIRSLIASVAVVSLTACMTVPSDFNGADLALADYGAPIDQPNAMTIAAQFMATHLKDPMSAQWQCSDVAQQYVSNGRLRGGGTLYGWGLQCSINAKNSFGGYVGARQHQFLFRDGRLVAVFGEERLSGGGTFMNRLL